MITKINDFIQINENLKQGKQYVATEKLSQENLDAIINIDPTTQKKYVGWIAKQFIANNFDISALKSYIEEYDVLVNKGKADQKDINQFKTIEEFKKYVDHLNNQGTASLKELENDFDVALDNDDVYIAVPNTFEASRKLGLTTFAHRDNCQTGAKESTWCTTYKNNSHFNDYFYKNNVTFYYTLIKNPEILRRLGGNQYEKVAFAVLSNGTIDAYDANDNQINTNKIEQIRKEIGI